MDSIFYIAILIMSIVLHEISHGFVAEYFGDKTARFAGRLTLNPIKHLDPFGSVILPAVLVLSGSPVLFGWAKPVPYNPANLNNLKWGTVSVAAAGVLANFFIAFVFGTIMRFIPDLNLSDSLNQSLYTITSIIVITNLALGIFNLIPIPPLDGSKILFTLLPRSFYSIIAFIEQYSLMLLLIFIVFLSDILFPIVAFLFHLFTGLAL
ncbi:MAG: site-2 protease family protein [Candidatus Pacebacteria bacterium]|nr:site-2 protease family protein [Candidatus Paceibacterota bacterium]